MLAAVSASAALRVLLLSDHLERKTQRRRWACAGSRLRPSESLGSGPQRRSCPRCWRGNRVGLHSVQRIGDTPGKPIYACFLQPLKGHDAPKPRDCCSIVSSRVSEPGATLNPRLQTLSAQEQAICAIKSAIKTAATSSHRFEMWPRQTTGCSVQLCSLGQSLRFLHDGRNRLTLLSFSLKAAAQQRSAQQCAQVHVRSENVRVTPSWSLQGFFWHTYVKVKWQTTCDKRWGLSKTISDPPTQPNVCH